MTNPLDPGTSPFAVEYIVQERFPVVDDVAGPGVYRYVTILTTDDYDIAAGTLAGLKMQCGTRAPRIRHELRMGPARKFIMLSRVVTPWATAEGTTAFLEAANEGLKLYDLAHGWPVKEGK